MKAKPYVHARTCVYNLNYHIIWCVKYRRKVLTPEMEDFLIKDLKEIAHDKGYEIVEANVGEGDHVHVFATIPPKISLTTAVSCLKGISGRHIFLKYPEIKSKLWGGHLWSGSYFAESIGSTSEENILRYIESQTNHAR